jgi:hypothetical protein
MSKELTPEAIEAAFTSRERARNLKKCTVGNLMEEYPALAPKIMDVEHYSAAFVSKVLRNLGVSSAADSTITRHRKGDCICPKETS